MVDFVSNSEKACSDGYPLSTGDPGSGHQFGNCVAGHFEPVVDANCRLVAPPPTRRTAIGGYPKVASYDMLGEQLHYSNPVKHGYTKLCRST